MKASLLVLSFFLATTLGFAQHSKIEQALFNLPDVQFERIKTPEGYESAYELKVLQPLDHKDASKGYFYQRVYLNHVGFDQVTTLVTEGYNSSRNRIYELSKLLGSNQIDVEHRFYGESRKDSLEYEFLTLEQATADLHHINQLFRKIYSGKWVSTGISKGGQTTIYYRYFYPEDVAVSVPYVAPMTLAFEDKRIYHFLDTVGDDKCRDAILQAQLRMLKNRDQAIENLKWYAVGADLTFEYHSLAETFEFAVLEFPFSFWQWGGKCDEIPSESTSFDDFMEYFISVSGIDFFADDQVDHYMSHYYQAATQMGYYGYETNDLDGMIKALSSKSNPHAAFTPDKKKLKYDGALSKAASDWLKKEGNQFLYIYGGADTWTACGVPQSDDVDAEWFVLAGKDHGAARIRNMSSEQQAIFISSLEKWLEIKIENPFLKNGK